MTNPLLERVRRQDRLDGANADRLAAHVAEAAAVGAHAALVTCSTVSPAVHVVQAGAAIPALKIDEAMIAEAVRLGAHIGVIATNPTTLTPTQQLPCDASQRAGKEIAIEPVLVNDAISALANRVEVIVFPGKYGAHAGQRVCAGNDDAGARQSASGVGRAGAAADIGPVLVDADWEAFAHFICEICASVDRL